MRLSFCTKGLLAARQSMYSSANVDTPEVERGRSIFCQVCEASLDSLRTLVHMTLNLVLGFEVDRLFRSRAHSDVESTLHEPQEHGAP